MRQPATSAQGQTGQGRFAALVALMVLALLVVLPGPALALKPIVIEPDQERLEITKLGEFYDGRGDSLQVETAPAADGMTGRISVTAKTPTPARAGSSSRLATRPTSQSSAG
jgi:hypothetical protein